MSLKPRSFGKLVYSLTKWLKFDCQSDKDLELVSRLPHIQSAMYTSTTAQL